MHVCMSCHVSKWNNTSWITALQFFKNYKLLDFTNFLFYLTIKILCRWHPLLQGSLFKRYNILARKVNLLHMQLSFPIHEYALELKYSSFFSKSMHLISSYFLFAHSILHQTSSKAIKRVVRRGLLCKWERKGKIK